MIEIENTVLLIGYWDMKNRFHEDYVNIWPQHLILNSAQFLTTLYQKAHKMSKNTLSMFIWMWISIQCNLTSLWNSMTVITLMNLLNGFFKMFYDGLSMSLRNQKASIYQFWHYDDIKDKPTLYSFLRLFGHFLRPITHFFLASLELLVCLLFKRGFYSRAACDSKNTVSFGFLITFGWNLISHRHIHI